MLKQLISEIHVVQQFQSCSAGKTFIENCNTYTETLFLGWGDGHQAMSSGVVGNGHDRHTGFNLTNYQGKLFVCCRLLTENKKLWSLQKV